MLVNGQNADAISIEDRGLLYGDGIFETILCEQGKPILFEQHVGRLHKGCERLLLATQDVDTLHSEVMQVAQGDDCVIKIMVTRGVRARGYRFDTHDRAYTRIVYRSPVPKIPENYYRQGISLALSDYRLPKNETLAGIKHLNRLDQVLACQGWEAEIAEKVMLDHEGLVVEGTMSNIFIETEGVLITPTLNLGGIEGVMRDWLINHAPQLSIDCQQQDFDLVTLEKADAIFMCNSVVGIWPVVRFQDYTYTVSDNVRQLMRLVNNKLSALYKA
jgi:4-amino-4-deoxychorismate lyase